MACEKYSDWIIDAALGALAPERCAELSAHATQCASCRESLAQSRVLAGAIDRGVETLVSAEPSPQFHARLRSRLADEAASRPAARFAWLPVAAAPAAVVALAALLLFRTPSRRAIAIVAVEHEASGATPAVGARTQQSPAVSLGTPPAASSHAYRVLALAGPQHAQRAGRQPEILVRPGELAMLQDVAQAARTGRFDPHQLNDVQQEHNSESSLAVEPVTVPALDVVPLPDPAPVASGS